MCGYRNTTDVEGAAVRVIKELILGLAFAGSIGVSASAQDMYLMNRGDWQALSPVERIGYAAAIFDKSLMAIYGVTWTVAFAEGLEACRADLGFTPADVAEETSYVYDNSDSMSDVPPMVVINGVLNDFCVDYIDKANTRHGVK